MPDDELPEIDAVRFATIVAHSSDAIVSKTLEGVVESWNPAAERLFGWSAEEMIGESIRRIVPPDRQDEEDAILARVCSGDIVPKFETMRLTKSGSEIPVAVTVSPMRDASGAIVGASKIANDLREQYNLREGLKEKSDQFTALAENIPQLAWIADPKGYIYWYNRRWFDFTGTTLESMEGWGWRKVHHPDHVDRVVDKVQRAWDSGEPWEDTFPLRRHDGVYRWFLSRANPLRDEAGNVILWCGTNTDITDQREASERIGLLMQEVNHRARNMLAIVQAIISRSSGRSAEALSTSLRNRIRALASSQELLNGGDWSGARVKHVVGTQVLHVAEPGSDQLRISGDDDLVMRAQPSEALGLAIHELATNALTYGSLSSPTGRVDIAWSLNGTPHDGEFEITWQESGGPKITSPLSSGFGTILMKRNVELAFGGKVKLEFAEEGLRWSASGPAHKILTGEREPVELDNLFDLRRKR
ncbi:PAS domain S-box protein [Qipengyuania sp.]|uniref:PAS domain S-box protein n=1 Tax=Qipengyuania sp. TaxID=2004515 RepID=UPI0035C87666